MNFLLLTHSKLSADVYVAVGRYMGSEFALMNLSTKTNGGFAQGIYCSPLSSIKEHSDSLCMPEGTVTATRVGS